MRQKTIVCTVTDFKIVNINSVIITSFERKIYCRKKGDSNVINVSTLRFCFKVILHVANNKRK